MFQSATLATLTLCFFFQSSMAEPVTPSTQPNILVIYADDLGWSHPSFMGHTFFETPVLDRLASQGMYFTNAYAPAANCAPSRASMLTGRWNTRHKMYSVESRTGIRENSLLDITETPIFKTTLEPSVDNIGRRLAEAGYYTSTLGKFHAGKDPVDFGFDSNVAGSSEGKPPTYYSPFKINNLRVKTPGLHLSDVLASYAIGEIKAAQLSDQPFFVLLSHFAVHTPMEPPKDLLVKYENKVGAQAEWVEYAAMLEGMDRATGFVLDYLENSGAANNTLVIFSSDNGARDEAGGRNANRPLKGVKGMLHEGGIRVPMVVRWPGVVSPGSVSHEPVTQLDWFPTLLEAAGHPVLDEIDADGSSIVPILRGTSLPERDLFWHFPSYLAGWGFQRVDARQTPATVLRRGSYKLIQYFENCSLHLFDLDQDQEEMTNLVEEKPALARSMLAAMEEWRSDADADTNTWIGFIPGNYQCLLQGKEAEMLARAAEEVVADDEEGAGSGAGTRRRRRRQRRRQRRSRRRRQRRQSKDQVGSETTGCGSPQ